MVVLATSELSVGRIQGKPIVHAVVVLQVVQAERELVGGADAQAVAQRQALFVEAAAGAIVVGLGQHGIDAQRLVFASVQVEVARDAAVVVAAQGGRYLVVIDGARLFADLVDRATGGATSEQHRGRAAQQLDTVVVEGVAFIEGRVAQAVHKDVARGSQGKAAQADVFLAALGRLEGDPSGVVQHVLEGVEVAVVHQLFRHHRDRLGNVAQSLVAFADAGGSGAQGVLAFWCFGALLHHHGFERLVGLGWALLRPGA